jgi:hypothetical protein
MIMGISASVSRKYQTVSGILKKNKDNSYEFLKGLHSIFNVDVGQGDVNSRGANV